ncbi:hypothetical protein TIFTF001_021298 [Ficus carica]|uniref:Uncharacterized protein n=1 Tax=Ficus carica TaxID=3494 RepID=A0AA88AHQ2_FICCA|nr:hypothetical protein TIFTF001_021298 [Ficus carica]
MFNTANVLVDEAVVDEGNLWFGDFYSDELESPNLTEVVHPPLVCFCVYVPLEFLWQYLSLSSVSIMVRRSLLRPLYWAEQNRTEWFCGSRDPIRSPVSIDALKKNKKMGLLFSRMFSSLFGNKEARILVLGLDNAGKTTILYRLQMGEVVSTIPTIGFNVETVQYNNIKFQVWDLGGQTSIRILSSENSIKACQKSAWIVLGITVISMDHYNLYRPYWRCYFPNTQAIIYVIDSSDTDRLAIAKEEFHAILEEEELRGAVVLIFANKQDLPGALDDAAITESLELHKIKNRQWAIFKTSAIKGEGLFEGLDWLSNTLKSGGG